MISHNSDGPRWWVVESHEYGASQPYGFVPDEYVGLVDENEGGIVAFGSFQIIEALAKQLNGPEIPDDYDPGTVMEKIDTEDLIDIGWAVLEGGDPLSLALEIYRERVEEEEQENT